MTSGKSALEVQIASEIKSRLRKQDRSKHWLATEVGLDYGKVKRVLNDRDSQQLSITVANSMLMALGTNLTDALLGEIIQAIREDIERDLAKYASAEQ
ncbi:MAG: hypothetical protein WAU54_05395 [Chania sp.]